VALLHLLVEAGFQKLVVCHLDHRLRGRASTEDAKFVRRLAEKLGLQCEIGRVDVRLRMKERCESLETAARHARHGFFAECAAKHRCRQVLLAHHSDDQAETVLWNLLRGSHGLKGMREEQTISVGGTKLRLSRPLLGLRRAELDPQGRLHLPALRKLSPALQRAALRKFLADQGVHSIDRTLLDRAVSLTDPAQPASINLPGGRRLRRREGRLWVDA
jgi:tRNA(Ile)-lysidine synthetase-like protein